MPKLSGVWYSAIYYPEEPLSQYRPAQDYSYVISPVSRGLEVKVNYRQDTKTSPCVPTETQFRNYYSPSVYRYYQQGASNQVRQSIIVHTDYDHMMVEFICHDIQADYCHRFSLAVFTRRRIANDDIINRALAYIPKQFVNLQYVKVIQNRDRTCERKPKQVCAWDRLPVQQDLVVGDRRMEGLWYRVREYPPASIAIHTANRDVYWVLKFRPGNNTWQFNFHFLPFGRDECITYSGFKMDPQDISRPALISGTPEGDVVAERATDKLVAKVVYVSSTMLIFVASPETDIIRGNAINTGVAIVTRQIHPSTSDIALAERIVAEQLCVDPTAYVQGQFTGDCVPPGSRHSSPGLSPSVPYPGIQSYYTSYPELTNYQVYLLKAKIEKLITEKEMLERQKAKLRLEVSRLCVYK